MSQDNIIKPGPIATPPNTCSMCRMQLAPGAAHLARQACIKDLQQAIGQLAAQLSGTKALVERLKTPARIGWILIDKMQGKSRVFSEDELKMPKGAQLRAEATDIGLVVTAVVKETGS